MVELHGTDHQLGALALARLHTFCASSLPTSVVPELRAARLPMLTQLELHFRDPPGAVLMAALAALLEHELPPTVTTVSVGAVEGAMPFLCRHLPSSRLARNARVLGFRHARMYPNAVEALATQTAALRRFEAVEVRKWGMTFEVTHSLERLLGPRLKLSPV